MHYLHTHELHMLSCTQASHPRAASAAGVVTCIPGTAAQLRCPLASSAKQPRCGKSLQGARLGASVGSVEAYALTVPNGGAGAENGRRATGTLDWLGTNHKWRPLYVAQGPHAPIPISHIVLQPLAADKALPDLAGRAAARAGLPRADAAVIIVNV